MSYSKIGAHPIISATAALLAVTRTDSELAFIVASEIAHYLAAHEQEAAAAVHAIASSNDRYHREVMPMLLLLSAGTVWKTGISLAAVMPFMYPNAAIRIWKASNRIKLLEKKAEYIGLLLMAAAGYDPKQAITVLKTLQGIYMEDKRKASGASAGSNQGWLYRRGYVGADDLSPSNLRWLEQIVCKGDDRFEQIKRLMVHVEEVFAAPCKDAAEADGADDERVARKAAGVPRSCVDASHVEEWQIFLRDRDARRVAGVSR